MQPVVRALRLLTSLARERSALSLQELANLQGLPASTVHRLIQVLLAEGFLTKSGPGKLYTLGPAARGLISNTSSDYIRRVSEPTMRRLNSETQETVILGEMVGESAICIASFEGRNTLRMYVQPSSDLPLHASATGRVLLSDLDDATARSVLRARAPLEKWTKNTITEIDEIVSHLEIVRSRGYDICEDEMQHSTWAIAAPIIDASGKVCASLGLVVPLQSVEIEDKRNSFASLVVAAATEVSGKLG